VCSKSPAQFDFLSMMYKSHSSPHLP
jgi:hypothetical protein